MVWFSDSIEEIQMHFGGIVLSRFLPFECLRIAHAERALLPRLRIKPNHRILPRIQQCLLLLWFQVLHPWAEIGVAD